MIFLKNDIPSKIINYNTTKEKYSVKAFTIFGNSNLENKFPKYIFDILKMCSIK